MSTETPETPSPIGEIAQGPSAMEQFLDRNQKPLLILAILIALGAIAYIVVQGIEKSRQQTAGAEFTKAEEIAELEAVVKNHPETKAAYSAKILLADKQWAEGKKDEAIATLQKFVTDNPDHPAAPSAQASLGAKWMSMGKAPEAVEMFEKVAKNPKSSHLAPYALICIGDIARSAGDLNRAEAHYKRVSEEFPNSDLANTVENRLQILKAKAPTMVEPPPAPEENSGDKPLELSLPGTPGAPTPPDASGLPWNTPAAPTPAPEP